MNLRAFPPAARRRRALVTAALAAAVATTAVGGAAAQDDGEPANAVVPGLVCSSLPRGLALIGNGPHGVWRVTRSSSTRLARIPRGVVTKAVRGRDGTMWVETRRAERPNGTWRRIVRIAADGRRQASESGDVRLSHVGTMGRPRGRTVATYIDRNPNPPSEVFGHVYVESSSGRRRSVGEAGTVVDLVASAAPAVYRVGAGPFASVVALGKLFDGSEGFIFTTLEGRVARGLDDPSDRAPFGRPLYSTPVLSPTGAKLSWAEGPEWSSQQQRFVGNWKLVIANAKTGAESMRLRVGARNEELRHADYDGRYWVGTFGKHTARWPNEQINPRAPKPSDLRVRVVDTRAANPRVVEIGCSTGFVASIDRFVND
jgi:hypothetical protein